MTLNINMYGLKHGLWTDRRILIRDTILSARPELIALQAVRKDPNVAGGLDQAAQLAELLAPAYPHRFFQPAMAHANGWVDGLALLSTRPIAGTEFYPLTLQPGLDDTNQRVLLRARFDLADGPFDLLNAHFSWVPEQNLANITEARPYLNHCPGPALLVGDFNATPETAGIRQLQAAGWRDAWATLRPEDPGYTFESNQPSLRIDYAWLNPQLHPHLKAIEMVATTIDNRDIRASDHFGLLITLDKNLS